MTQPIMHNTDSALWPHLNYEEGKATYQTLHLFTQIVGKIKLVKLPWTNHSWHVALTVTPSGITSGSIPYDDKYFQIDFDLCRHKLVIKTDAGEYKEFDLQGLSVANFYKQLMDCLNALHIQVKIKMKPNEVDPAIRFNEDETHKTYDPVVVKKLHKALLTVTKVMTDFRSEFKGKCSPVHLFWGSFDLAVSRFSGRKAPKHPGGVPNLPNAVAEEAYSHEVSSCGFWPGNEAFPEAAFYAYTYPEPEGYSKAEVQPAEAYYNEMFKEYILPYEAVRKSSDPADLVLNFFRSTYKAGALLAKWDIESLE